jgi:SAM-dependent methyltransferase
MRLEAAVTLIRPAVAPGEAWAELGAGEGTFTRALGELVGAAGSVWASDRDPAAVRTLGALTLLGGADLHVVQSDFTGSPELPPVDGVLMANALHFARDQERVMHGLVRQLPPGGKLLLVEYDRTRANPWVPYPVPLARFRALAAAVGLSPPEKIGRRASSYQGEMYAAVCRRIEPPWSERLDDEVDDPVKRFAASALLSLEGFGDIRREVPDRQRFHVLRGYKFWYAFKSSARRR